jgi:ribosome-binding protein aMBF1 (putative translation factor)
MRSSDPAPKASRACRKSEPNNDIFSVLTLRPVVMMKPQRNLTQLIHRRVASRIRGRRLQVGMTQQQLARIIRVAFQQVHKYEHGLSRVSADRLYQIATALDSPVGYFFSAEDGLAPTEERIAEHSKYGTNDVV